MSASSGLEIGVANRQVLPPLAALLIETRVSSPVTLILVGAGNQSDPRVLMLTREQLQKFYKFYPSNVMAKYYLEAEGYPDEAVDKHFKSLDSSLKAISEAIGQDANARLDELKRVDLKTRLKLLYEIMISRLPPLPYNEGYGIFVSMMVINELKKTGDDAGFYKIETMRSQFSYVRPHYFIVIIENNAQGTVYYIDFSLEQFSPLGFFKEVEELLAWSFLHENVSSSILDDDLNFREELITPLRKGKKYYNLPKNPYQRQKEFRRKDQAGKKVTVSNEAESLRGIFLATMNRKRDDLDSTIYQAERAITGLEKLLDENQKMPELEGLRIRESHFEINADDIAKVKRNHLYPQLLWDILWDKYKQELRAAGCNNHYDVEVKFNQGWNRLTDEDKKNCLSLEEVIEFAQRTGSLIAIPHPHSLPIKDKSGMLSFLLGRLSEISRERRISERLILGVSIYGPTIMRNSEIHKEITAVVEKFNTQDAVYRIYPLIGLFETDAHSRTLYYKQHEKVFANPQVMVKALEEMVKALEAMKDLFPESEIEPYIQQLKEHRFENNPSLCPEIMAVSSALSRTVSSSLEQFNKQRWMAEYRKLRSDREQTYKFGLLARQFSETDIQLPEGLNEVKKIWELIYEGILQKRWKFAESRGVIKKLYEIAKKENNWAPVIQFAPMALQWVDLSKELDSYAVIAFVLAHAYEETGQLEEAIDKGYQRIIRTIEERKAIYSAFEDYTKALYYTGVNYTRLKEYEKARKVFEKLINFMSDSVNEDKVNEGTIQKMNQTFTLVLCRLAEIYTRLSYRDSSLIGPALEFIGQAAQISPSDSNVLWYQGCIYFAQADSSQPEKMREALEYMEKAIANKFPLLEANVIIPGYEALACAYYKRGDKEAAIKAHGRSAELVEEMRKIAREQGGLFMDLNWDFSVKENYPA